MDKNRITMNEMRLYYRENKNKTIKTRRGEREREKNVLYSINEYCQQRTRRHIQGSGKSHPSNKVTIAVNRGANRSRKREKERGGGRLGP